MNAGQLPIFVERIVAAILTLEKYKVYMLSVPWKVFRLNRQKRPGSMETDTAA